jgi:transposase-like protein
MDMSELSPKEMTKQVRLTQWAQIVHERKESGQSNRAWCRENGINEKTYYYWQRRLREAACDRFKAAQLSKGMSLAPTRFTEAQLAASAIMPVPAAMESSHQLHLEIGGIKIAADREYPIDKLAILLKELSRSC